MHKTTDYSMFKKHPSNREISNTNLQRIISSIKSRNLLEFRPMLVNQHFEVIDGQHRLEAAKTLGVEIYYTVDPTSAPEDIMILNNNQKVWDLDSYLNYHLSFGNVEYQKFTEFQRMEGLNIREGMNLLRGLSDCSRAKFREGGFKFPSALQYGKLSDLLSKFKSIMDLIERMKIDGKQVSSKYKFREALIEFLRSEDVDFEILRHKISINLDKVRLCATAGGYLIMLRDIYNWKNKNPMSLLNGTVVP